MGKKMVECKACGREIAKSAKFCLHCGAKRKKPFFLRWWFILIVIIGIGIIALNSGSDDEKILWEDIILGDMLPEPPANKGEIHTNSAEDLWIDISSLSDKQFNDYIDACKEKGFTVDAEYDSYSYKAYNSGGYKLSLRHYSSDADMSIQLDVPMEMAAIVWPASTAGQKLPAPKSTTGKFSYEYDDNFFVYVGNTSRTDYAEYVNACSEMGFNVDYSKGDDYYYADNSEGWHISVCYEGNSIMSIHIDAPSEDDSTDTSTPSSDSSTQASEPDAAENESEKDTSNNGGLDPDFKAAMDSYEAFIDEYVAFMKKYNKNPNDISLITDYADYIGKYSEFAASIAKWEDEDLNNEELAYYIDVQARVSKKLLEAVQ